MDTPIFNFVNKYSDESFIRLHMPGHKGQGEFGESLDITEISGADCLLSADGIIAQSEKNSSSLFNTQKTLFSTQGSTLAIQTMLALVATRKNAEKPLVIAVRNAHIAFLNSCALLDIDVFWVYPQKSETSITSVIFLPLDIENAILKSPKKPSAVFVTSPNYMGEIADIKGISTVCKRHSVPLLVDNAHGAYLNFLEKNRHPIALGADMCCDSAHKTLPVLTGGGYLHISKSADLSFSQNAKSAMSLFSSTSPSYLTLASLDRCNLYLLNSIRFELDIIIPQINRLKNVLIEKGYEVLLGEPLKLSICTLNTGFSGVELADILRNNKIECEYSDESHIVLMFSTNNTRGEILALEQVLLGIVFKEKAPSSNAILFENLPSALSIRQAVFSPSEEIEVDNSDGRICSKPAFACPPGVPIVVSGEIITKNTIKILKRYSIFNINVVK